MPPPPSPSPRFILRPDPCGLICILITYAAIFYSDYVIIKWIVLINYYDSLWGTGHAVAYNLVVLLLLLSHGRAVVSDPGLVEVRSDVERGGDPEKSPPPPPPPTDWSICNRCDAYRPPRAHHCRICKRCVRRMDHHCPWINNCVGEYNQKYFIQFLLYVGLLSVYASALVIWSWTSADCDYCPKDLLTRQSKILHSVLLVLESLLFGMFVLAILIDQLSAVFSDETAVEHVKNRHSRSPRPHHLPTPKPRMQLLGEVCGRGPVYMWLLPCRAEGRREEGRIDYDV